MQHRRCQSVKLISGSDWWERTFRCSCGQKVRGLGLRSHHGLNLRTRHGRLSWVKGRTKVPLLHQLCYNSRPKQTLRDTHTRMHWTCFCVRLNTGCTLTSSKRTPCCEPSCLNSFCEFCHFGVLKCCCRKHKKGITSHLAVTVTKPYTVHTHKQAHTAELTLSCKRDMTHY